jgi:small-conductance mechanosensitive channel
MISEKPFEIGDVIKMGSTAGIVLSIDLLSVKIKTFDNQYIRIPNEKLLGSELTNITRFPIRRLDINLGEFLFGLWFFKTDYLNLKNSVMQEIKERFDREGIEIPFPHLSVYTGSVTDPMPIRILNDPPAPGKREKAADLPGR